ncbi:Rne/Rng family ribonuclease [Fusobacterium mortiferum]|jgi:ribonuclease G|uniref:Ribonuclease G n=1 Tax=Fusobacterium mortiferum TaxID=850 RepID=A0A414Q0D9_FUSMR|nr:Rne/Rng family ribonuclease [Fusobacterium mortiferum]MCF2699065.1 Rne/Rng family ribonuclease [Fusobacterium mortiferum]MCI6381473.1 Rne/Rng family ribonuclease [Fusobacterium mortiferum]MCI7666420.1 Rne/Rng family ribonuclease [Fusobacterium mortiferum]MDD7263024.1 Rne/Rng family ribonuclease [Fusobacterium mortiferum]MDY4802448.1 Rne/Rng family ribonuclease [Fusobacterium mortiferum]
MNQIVINIDEFQSRAAIIEDEKVVEVLIEREEERRINANIYKGKVANVLPGMESAFVNIGLEKNAFLYVNDLREFEEKYLDGICNSERPIEDILTVGDEVVVQVLSEPRGTKGARVTTHYTIPGKYLVLMPNNNHIAISKKIKEEEERNRLEEIVRDLKPENMGVIIRTAAQGKSIFHFEREMEYLVKKWEDIEKKTSTAKIGEVLYKDNGIVATVLRDIFSNEIDELVIDNEEAYWEVIDYINAFSEKTLKTKIKLYNDDEIGIFERYGIEKEIENALKEEVRLECGGYLVIQKTEALISIDVNTGKNTGSYNLEQTVLNTNLEAAREIPRQLRLRNLGGIIIIDFIDMRLEEDKLKVLEALEQNLSKDRIKNNIVHFTDLGLIEMTRKRTGKPLYNYFQERCPMCEGTGKIKSKDSVIHEMMTEIKECAKDEDINIIKVILSKKLKIAFKELYFDFVEDFVKNRKKKIILEENSQNDYSYEIILMK